jgi:hypothetical protein
LKDNGVALPANFAENVAQNQGNKPAPIRSIDVFAAGSGSMNPGDVRDVKIRLSKKEIELKDLKEAYSLL